jgi:hypothetical protein
MSKSPHLLRKYAKRPPLVLKRGSRRRIGRGRGIYTGDPTVARPGRGANPVATTHSVSEPACVTAGEGVSASGSRSGSSEQPGDT